MRFIALHSKFIICPFINFIEKLGSSELYSSMLLIIKVQIAQFHTSVIRKTGLRLHQIFLLIYELYAGLNIILIWKLYILGLITKPELRLGDAC